MVDGDWIAFPVCEAVGEADWSSGTLCEGISYWRQKNWVQWVARGTINYFSVAAFRSALHARSRTKGIEEGSENVIAWDATFSTRDGTVERIIRCPDGSHKVTIRRASDGHRYTWTIVAGKHVVVAEGQQIGLNQVVAASVQPLRPEQLVCPHSLPANHIAALLSSRERTQRFTGIKLARLRQDGAYCEPARSLAADLEEDVYVRLEAVSYLNAVCGDSAHSLFGPYLSNGSEQTQLEATIALGQSATPEATEMLCGLLADTQRPFFLRSAAAWALSQTGSDSASPWLVSAFADVDFALRQEALDGLVRIGGPALPTLLEGLRHSDSAIAAGCAEAIRRSNCATGTLFNSLLTELRSENPSRWAVWLAGHLPREQFAAAIAELQYQKPELHYAITLLWSFVESWIARNWDVSRNPWFRETEVS
jgi:HEAT repeat protein